MTKLQQENAVAALLPMLPYKLDGLRYRRRRFRGQKRYYRNIEQRAKDFQPYLSVGSWYDLWHYHAGGKHEYSHLGWKHRRAHIEALCSVFRTFARSVEEYYQPYQLWLYLDREECRQDTVYFHTPNPNGEGDHFPLKLKDIAWGLPALEGYIGGLLEIPVQAGVLTQSNGERMYFIYSPAYGEPLA